MRGLTICHNKYYSSDQTEEHEMGATCGLDGGYENAYRILVGKAEGKRPPGRQCVDGRIVLK